MSAVPEWAPLVQLSWRLLLPAGTSALLHSPEEVQYSSPPLPLPTSPAQQRRLSPNGKWDFIKRKKKSGGRKWNRRGVKEQQPREPRLLLTASPCLSPPGVAECPHGDPGPKVLWRPPGGPLVARADGPQARQAVQPAAPRSGLGAFRGLCGVPPAAACARAPSWRPGVTHVAPLSPRLTRQLLVAPVIRLSVLVRGEGNAPMTDSTSPLFFKISRKSPEH